MTTLDATPLFGADIYATSVQFSENTAPEPLSRKSLTWLPRQALLNTAATVAIGGLLTLGFAHVFVSNAIVHARAFAKDSPVALMAAVAAKLKAFTELPADWAGRGAIPLDTETMTHALAVFSALVRPGLPMPAVVPTGDGGVQFEWHNRGFDAEVHVASRTEVDVFLTDMTTGAKFEYVDIKSVSDLLPAAEKLSTLL